MQFLNFGFRKTGISSQILKDLELLIKSRYPFIAIETYEEERVEEILFQISSTLKIDFFVWTVIDGLKRVDLQNPIQGTENPIKALDTLSAIENKKVCYFKDLHRYFGDVSTVRKLQDTSRPFTMDRSTIVFSAPSIQLPPELEKLSAFYRLDLPSPVELKQLAKEVLEDLSKQNRIKVELSSEEFEHLVGGMKGFTLFEAERALSKAVLDDQALTRKDLKLINEIKKELLQKEGVLEYFLPEENFSQIGGLKKLKNWLEIRKNSYSPEAAKFGISPPKGILLIGVQGCGKSLSARAVAREWDLPFFKMEPGRLYEKYIGDSEKNFEKALKLAERMAPCVLMIDEIEKGFTYVGSSEADAGLSRRIFGRLVGWLQDKKAPVFVVATCNDLSVLPPELMRKGRFDEIFFIDLPSLQERKDIFAIHLIKRKRNLSEFNFELLSEASQGFSGAEIEQAIVSALYTAFSKKTDINTDLIVEELKDTKPLSVTREEEIEALREWALQRTVKAN